MIIKTKELLYHFVCLYCNKWWSIGEHQETENVKMYCPHCGKQSEIKENDKFKSIDREREFD